MNAIRPGLRQTMAWLHGWAGLVLGWLLFAIAASGTASVFKAETSDWMRPEISGTASQIDALSRALSWLGKTAPTSPDWYLTPPDGRSTATIASYEDVGAVGDARYRMVALSPLTGRPEGIRDTLGGEFLYRFHFELQLPYPWGRLLASAAAMLLLVTLLSGIITHRRIFADFFTMRPGKGKRSWLDAHNALGVLAMPFHLMIAITGVLTLISLTLPWAAAARYAADIARYDAEAAPGLVERARVNRPARAIDSAAMLTDAVRRFGGGWIGQVSVTNPGDAAAVLRVTRNDADQLAYGAATASYDMPSGRLIAFHAETRPAQRTYKILYGLHMGRFAPILAHWLYFLCGLALTATIATGLILWTQSRAAADSMGHRLVARLTAGTVAGMPLAIAGYFWANRLIPIATENRAANEVAAFFMIWAAAYLFALSQPTKGGWVVLWTAAGAAWVSLPLISALTTTRGLNTSLAAGDWTFAAFDIVSLGLGMLAGRIALVTARHRPPAPRARRSVSA